MSAFEVKHEEVTALLVDGMWRLITCGSLEYANECVDWPRGENALGNVRVGGWYRYVNPQGDIEIVSSTLVEGFRHEAT